MNTSRCMIADDTVFFFDLDGTLVETNEANFLAYQTAVAKVKGIKILKEWFAPEERIHKENLKTWLSDLTDQDIAAIVAYKEQCYQHFLCTTKRIAHTTETLLRYSTTHPMVLVSKGRRNRIVDILKYHELLDKFTHVFCREDLISGQTRNKFQHALTCLGLSADKVIAFENEAEEISDAQAVNIPIINHNIL